MGSHLTPTKKPRRPSRGAFCIPRVVKKVSRGRSLALTGPCVNGSASISADAVASLRVPIGSPGGSRMMIAKGVTNDDQ